MFNRMILATSAVALAACGTTAGGGGAGGPVGPKQTVAAEGAACVPATMTFGCLMGGHVLMRCDPANSLWAKVKDCAVGEICSEGKDNAGLDTAQCMAVYNAQADAGVDAGTTDKDGVASDVKLPPQDGGGGGDTVLVTSDADTPKDAGPTDTAPVDSGPVDAGPVDTGPVDTGPVDTGPVDTGPTDAGATDIETPDVQPDPVNTNIPQPILPCPSGTQKTSKFNDHVITYSVTKGPGGDDIMHGPIEWKLSTTVVTKGCFNNNKRYGSWLSWHADNAAKSTNFYFNQSGEMHGLQESWYDNGQKYFYGTFSNGDAIGMIDRWHKNGQMRSKAYYDSKGEIHGPYKSWHDNGAKSVAQVFIHGKSQGLTTAWFDKGQISFQGAWDKGLHEGAHTDWHEGGGVAGKNTYKNGNGDYKLVHENGKNWILGSRKDGERHGTWDWWDDQGNKVAHAELNLGSGPFTEWFPNGKLATQGTFKEEQRHGPFKEWAESGNLKSEGSYFEGSQHGTWTYYDDQGAKAYTLCIIKGAIARFEPCTSGMLN